MVNLTTLLCAEAPAADDLRYGRHRAGVRRPVVVWTATRSCNLACKHCYSASLKRTYPGELSTSEAEALIDDLAAMPAARLLVSGGEPLLRPDVLGMIRRAHRGGLLTTLSTNGTALARPAMADAVAASGVSYVGISFDGVGEVHDRFRGEQGAFDRSLAGVRNLVARGQRVGLRTTLTRSSVSRLDEVFALVADEGFSRACFYHLAPAGRGRRADDERLGAEETREAVDRIIAFADGMRRERPDVEVLTVANAADGPRLVGWLEERGRDASSVRARLARSGGDRSGVALAHVSSTGEVHPDQFSWTTRLGSVRDRPFSRIWTDAQGVLADLRDRRGRIGGRCADCRFLDLCGGNLRMRAEVAGGDPWGADPGCYLRDAEVAA